MPAASDISVTGKPSYSTTTGGSATSSTYTLAAAATSADEGTKATFNLTTANVTAGTEVAYTITGIDAADLASGSLTGKATVGTDGKASITVDLKADLKTEGAETLVVTLDGKTGTGSSATTTVNDTSKAPTYTLTSSAASVNEGSSVTFDLTTNVTSGTALSYELSGTGITDADVKVATKGTLTVGTDGKASLTVPTVADSKTEGNETLTLTLKDASAASVATASTTISDTSTTPPYSVSVSKSQVQEGGSFQFTITPAEDVQTATTVQWNLQGDTIGGSVVAADFNDVSPNNGKVTFAAGTKAGVGTTVTVAVTNDSTAEALEGMRFYLLKDDANNTVLDQNQTVTIEDVTYKLTSAASSVNEGDTVTFSLAASNVADGTKISYTLSGVSAADVTGGLLTGSVTMSAGAATISVPIAKDFITDSGETLTVTLDGSTVKASVAINDTSTTPTYTLTANQTSVNEGASATFVLQSSDATDVSTQAYTLSGTGIDAADATGGLTGSVTLVGGKATITVAAINDMTTEGAEIVTVTAASKTATTSIADTSVLPILATDTITGTTVSGQGTAIIKQSTLLANYLDSTGKAAPTGAVTASTVTNGNGQIFNSSNGDIIFIADSGKREGSFAYNVAGIDSAIKGTANVIINTAPAITSPTALSTAQDTPLAGSIVATDADGDTLTYTYTADHGTVAVGTGGVYTPTPTTGYLGADTIKVTVADNYTALPLTSTTSVPVTVTASTTPTFSVTAGSARSEGGNATFTVTWSAAQAAATSVVYTLAGVGTAVLGTDTGTHVPAGNTGTLTFAAGEVTKTVTVPIATDVTSPETDEGVSLTLSAPSTGTAVAKTPSAQVLITDEALICVDREYPF
ncbi:MAG: hypothetical protein IPH35_16790 [Rhodoferax sp.]|nr:hypothetical protein [Rhodoferax sp.]